MLFPHMNKYLKSNVRLLNMNTNTRTWICSYVHCGFKKVVKIYMLHTMYVKAGNHDPVYLDDGNSAKLLLYISQASLLSSLRAQSETSIST